MEDYKKDAEVYGADILVTNVIELNIKSNDVEFARAWLERQLAPILKMYPVNAELRVRIRRLAEDNAEYVAEVYGKVNEDGNIEVFEHVKNHLFGTDNEVCS